MEPYQSVAEEDPAITINLKLSDESVRPVSLPLSSTVSDLKKAVRVTQAFEEELASGQTAVLIFQGKFMKDGELLSAFRECPSRTVRPMLCACCAQPHISTAADA